MSEQPQGSGWWRASDGRWYPPQPYPGPSQPYPGPGQQPYPGPGQQPYPSSAPQQPYPPVQQPAYRAYGTPQPGYGGGAVPPPRSGGSRKVLVIVLAVVLVVVVLPGIGIWYVAHTVKNKAQDVLGGGPCSLVANDTAARGLDAPISLQSGKGIAGIVSGVIDDRVLAKAPSCWGTTDPAGASSGTVLVRIAVQQGGDAAGTYQRELKQAKGAVVSDDGKGTTVETMPYFGSAQSGLGDEAFCTTLGLTGTIGVLVRKGDKLVYASVGLAALSGSSPDPGKVLQEADGKGEGCDRAKKLATAVLNG